MILKLWSIDPVRVRLLQTELNRIFPNDRPQLKVDGIFGQTTRSRVIKLQQSNRELVVNGVFDPETQAELKKRLPDTKLVGSNASTTTAVAKGSQIKFHNELKEVFNKEGTKKDWELFIKAIDQSAIPEIKKILLGLQLAETARLLARVFIAFRRLGFGINEMKVIYSQFLLLKDSDLDKVLKVFAAPNNAVSKILKVAGPIASKMGLIVTFVECMIFAKKGNYAAIFGEIYKFIMGKAIPWAGLIDALQSFVELVVPKSWQLNAVFKILKVANPIGLGAVAIESIAASATAAYYVIKARGDFGAAIPRLDKLVKRMKKSPASVFVEIGDNAGSSAYQLSRMSSTEWGLIMSYKWRQFKNLF